MKFCDSKFYRITYEGEGIYNALKNHVDLILGKNYFL